MLLTLWTFVGTLDVAFTQDDFWLLNTARAPWPNGCMLRGSLPDYVRPLSTYWWQAANVAVWGLEPRGHHAALLALLAATVHALFRALHTTTGSLLAAALGTLVYGLCQVHAFTLGWIAGAIEGLAACGFAHALWALARHREGLGSAWPAWLAVLLAMLAKEPAVIVPVAAFVAATIRPGRDVARVDDVTRGRRLWLGFAVVTAAYLALWFWLMRGTLTAPGAPGTFGPSLVRPAVVLRDAVVLANPWTPHDEPAVNAWVALPFALVALTLWQRRTWRVPQVWFAALLCVLPAAIFGLTRRPEFLQRYYGHFSVFGLALLVALAACRLLANRTGAARVWRVLVLLGLCAVHAWTAAGLGRTLVAERRSPPLSEGVRSGAAWRSLQPLLQGNPAREVWLLDVDDNLWWALGKGWQLRVFFPHVEPHFDGHAGERLPPGAATDERRLVLRRSPDDTFTVVR